MATISFQNETQFQQRALTPFGSAQIAGHFCDPVAEMERDRAQATAVCFGRRAETPTRKASAILFKSAA